MRDGVVLVLAGVVTAAIWAMGLGPAIETVASLIVCGAPCAAFVACGATYLVVPTRALPEAK